MPEPPQARRRAGVAFLKTLYLLAVTVAVFTLPAVEGTRFLSWYVVPALLAAQMLMLLACCGGTAAVFRAVWRLKWFFVFLMLCYTLLPAPHPAHDSGRSWEIPGTPWSVTLNVTGLGQAVLMCLQVLTVVLASAVVRLTGSGTDLVDGLRVIGLPGLFVHSFDQTLELLGGAQRPGTSADARTGARRQGTGEPAPGLLAVLGRLLRGDIGVFLQSIRDGIERARKRVAEQPEGRLDARLAQDVAVVTGVALVMVSLKVVKLLPGVPFAPGLKSVVLFPLYVLAAQLTRSGWGATAAGSIMGVIAFLTGDGRYGVLDVFQHITPGLMIDLSMPMVRRLPPSTLVFCLLGFVAALARTSTELLVVLLLGARTEIYLFPAVKLVPNVIAGTMSGFVTAYVVRAFRVEAPAPDTAGSAEAPAAGASTSETACRYDQG
jgi:hypothetical protein